MRKISYISIFVFSLLASSCKEGDKIHVAGDSGDPQVNEARAVNAKPDSDGKNGSLGRSSLDPKTLDSIVKSALNSAYGADNFNPSRNCWRHSFPAGDNSIDYCMVAAKPAVIDGEDGVRIYLQTYSDPQAEIYSQVDPGLEGLFFIGSDADQKWSAIASSPAIDMGQAGDCGCRDVKLIEVGPGRYGWLSTVGGVWQGVPVTRYSLQVPMGSEIRDVSTIPRVSEKSPDYTNSLEVDLTGKVSGGMYPLKVTRNQGGAVVGTHLIAYDENKRIYDWKP